MSDTIDFEQLRAPFPAEDVKWRIGQSGLKQNGEPWAKVLAYIDARAVTERLDEVCGPFGWQRSCRYIQAPATQDDGKTVERDGFVCAISIRDPASGEWITREDGAGLSDIEPFKGGISDSFKRAGSAWGIGAYLYKIEETWAECSKHTGAFPNFGSGFDKRSKQRFTFSWKTPDLSDASPPASGNGERPPRRERELDLDSDTALAGREAKAIEEDRAFPGSDVADIGPLQKQYASLANDLRRYGLDVRERGYAAGDSKRLPGEELERRIRQMMFWMKEVS